MNADELPPAAELLRTAREVLLRELLPLLPEERKYDGLLVASAIAIAQRTLQAPALPDTFDPAALAAAIRAGLHDEGAARDQALAALRARVQHAIAINNPKAG